MTDDIKIIIEKIMGWKLMPAADVCDPIVELWINDTGTPMCLRDDFNPRRDNTDLMILWDAFASKVHGTSVCHNKANNVHIAYWCDADEVRRNTTTDHDRRKAMCDCMLGWVQHLATQGDSE